MGFVGLLQFSLKCFDVLAWPLVALVYPLCASVRAIETNSNYHMRKLVTYWVLFSLISLFEHDFVRVIERLPFWPQIKLIFVCWLVIPRFNGAYYAYKSLVHLCLSVDLQAVVEWLNKPKDEFSLKPETFLAVAETYVQKNGTEALEKLIASKCNEPNIVQKDVKTLKPNEKNAAATAAAAVKSCKEPNIAQKDVKAVEPPKKNAAAAAKRTEKKAVAAVEVEEMTEPAARKEDKLRKPQEKNAAAAAKWIEPIRSGNLPLGFDPSTCRSVYVGNIHTQVTKPLLQEVFASTGPVESCLLIRKEKSSYGFIHYFDPRSASLAIFSLNGWHLFGQPIKVNWAYASGQREDTSRVYQPDLSSVSAGLFTTNFADATSNTMWSAMHLN